MTPKPQSVETGNLFITPNVSFHNPLFGGWIESHTIAQSGLQLLANLSQVQFPEWWDHGCEHLVFCFDDLNILLCSSDWPRDHYLPALGFSMLYQAQFLFLLIIPTYFCSPLPI